jgi:hypothetical protein
MLDASRIYYCKTCDSMVYMQPVPFFRLGEWRSDTFVWRNPPINVPAELERMAST